MGMVNVEANPCSKTPSCTSKYIAVILDNADCKTQAHYTAVLETTQDKREENETSLLFFAVDYLDKCEDFLLSLSSRIKLSGAV